MKKFNYFLQYIFVIIFFNFLRLLPLHLSQKFASFCFRYIGRFSSAQKTSIENCKLVFPDLTNTKIKKIVERSWGNIGKNICELINFKKFLKKGSIIIKGIENIEQLKRNNNQAIFIGIHQSNWEVVFPMLDRIGFKVSAIYRHINNIFLENLILKTRNDTLISKNNFYTQKGKKGAKDIIDSLKNNYCLFLLIDQKDSAGEEIIFFDKKVKTQTGFLKIARRFNLPIIPIKNTRLKDGKIELSFLKPIHHNKVEINDIKMMEIIHREIEKWIISNPEQWFWQHKRFN